MSIARFFVALPLVGSLASSVAWACVTCGGGQAFNPAVLIIGSGFILLPLGLVALVAYRVWKDSKNRDRSL